MTNTAGKLRAAADCIDDARTDLEYGDLDDDVEEIQGQIERADEIMQTLDDSLRELASLEAVVAGVDDDQ